jgi:acyl-CoA synthetase (AMP-forming)/AMP-acid ligase II
MTVHATFAATARAHADRPFLAVLPETAAIYGIAAGEMTYGAAAARIAALAEIYRRQGYGLGHRVGVLLENRPAFFLHWFAFNSLGVSIVPINPDLRSAELDYLIGHSEIAAAVAIPSRQASLRAVPVFGPDETPPAVSPRSGTPDIDTECALLYTSGTTGRPKGCVLANEYFVHAGRWYADAGGLIAMARGRERMLTPLPLFHMNAMAYSAMAMVTTAGCLIVLDRFHPKTWWTSVHDSGATIVHYLGIMPAMLMGAPAAMSDREHGVRFGFGAGADRRLHAAFEERFGFPLIEAWAMTETGAGSVVVANSEPRHVGSNCFGRPGADMEVRVVADDGAPVPPGQPGELLVRHAGARPRYGFFREYLKDAEATAEAWAGGWFHTGDVVRAGDGGALCFVDRKKNVIRRSGENISAVEVESVLAQHPAVAQVAVAAAPDDLRGDEVVACIVPREAVSDAAELARGIVAWCLERLAYYKAPGYVAFVQAVPLTSTNKIQRGELRALAVSVVQSAACVDTRAMKKRTA